ncbi:hypothetical protein EF910_17795 [Streptomyces sp. WAC07149]|uniref:DUF6585 family protein n=1 Tax=Streptomyces sp. WAC07149 TaxID=2487425 RepID=UPI000F78C7AF|nr:DUF6585 family protein [Streptomyces sp. WAC07149]RST04385.1 hypothetical protein EF910_17795 [Streptomyces sp. WAC07149]
MTEPLPTDVRETAEQAGLGCHRRSYGATRGKDFIQRLDVFDHGIAIRSEAGVCLAITWPELKMYESATSLYGAVSHFYHFEDYKGHNFPISASWKNSREMAQMLRDAIAGVWVPDALQRIAEGKSRVFVHDPAKPAHQLALSREGVVFGTETLPWEHIKYLRLHDGNLIIKRHKKFRPAVYPSGKIPNLYSFMQIAQALHTGVG